MFWQDDETKVCGLGGSEGVEKGGRGSGTVGGVGWGAVGRGGGVE